MAARLIAPLILSGASATLSLHRSSTTPLLEPGHLRVWGRVRGRPAREIRSLEMLKTKGLPGKRVKGIPWSDPNSLGPLGFSRPFRLPRRDPASYTGRKNTVLLSFLYVSLIASHAIAGFSIPGLMFRATNGEVFQTMQLLTIANALCAIREFFWAPWVGRKTDREGRRFFVLLEPAVVAVVYYIAFAFTSIQTLMLAKILANPFPVTSPSLAALADVNAYDISGYTKLQGRLMSFGALAVMAGGTVGSFFAQGELKLPLLVAAVTSLCPLVLTPLLGLRETNRDAVMAKVMGNSGLEEENVWKDPKKGIKRIFTDAFSFVRFFKHPSLVRVMSIVFILQCARFSIGEIGPKFGREVFNWDGSSVRPFMVFLNVITAISGFLVGPLVNSIGTYGILFVGNIMAILSNLILTVSNTPEFAYWAMVLQLFGASAWLAPTVLMTTEQIGSNPNLGNATIPMSTLVLNQTDVKTEGKGVAEADPKEIVGGLRDEADGADLRLEGYGRRLAARGNMLAILIPTFSFIFNKLFLWGLDRNFAGLPFLVSAGCFIASQVLIMNARAQYGWPNDKRRPKPPPPKGGGGPDGKGGMGKKEPEEEIDISKYDYIDFSKNEDPTAAAMQFAMARAPKTKTAGD
ncbi:hypothetical protein AAMO2058_000039800 [Amorphochlora amoebiformis]